MFRDRLKPYVSSPEKEQLEPDRDEVDVVNVLAPKDVLTWSGAPKTRELALRPVAPVGILVRDLSVRLDLKAAPWLSLSNLRWKRRTMESSTPRAKAILDQVNAHMPAGSITAIIGASGSGKTSLLNVLSRRLNDSHWHQTGEIQYSGHLGTTSVLSAYVMQEDVLTPTLTVRETLQYAAELRLPTSTTADEHRIIIEDVMTELGLTSCADTRIGDDIQRGCSGGERRRVGLAIQLLVNPSILFLDEVTTGLDAASAFQLVRTLKQLASRGRTIVLTIHQPRSEIWGLFDHVVLLAGGGPLFSGPTDLCLHHFDHLGFPLAPFVNPAEHLIDLAAVDYRSPEREESSSARVDRLRAAWREVSVNYMTASSHFTTVPRPRKQSGPPATFMRQVKTQTARALKMTWRDPWGCFGSLVECLTIAILTGWIFFNLDGSQSGIRSREGALYIAMTLQNYLITLFETYQLTRDIGVFDRERAEGVVGVTSFLVSRRMAKLFLTDLPVPLIYSIIFYFMIGFRRQAAQFFICFTFVLLTHYVSVSFATVAVSLSRDFAGASLIANMNSNLQALCSGFLIQSNQIPVYVRWLKWVAYVWYANGALVNNEFIGDSTSPTGYLYDCPYPGGASDPACAPWTGRFVVTLLGFPQENWIWRPAIILVGFIGAFSIAAGLVLAMFQVETRIARSRPTKPEGSEAAAEPPTHKSVPHRPLAVTLENVGLEIEKRSWFGRRKHTMSILKPVSMEFRPGTLNVIIGASGSGKTSLLSLMAGRLPSTYTARYKSTGTTLIEGSVPSIDVVRSVTSFVCQSDDALLPNLTVRETLFFAAHLRLPTWLSTEEKAKRAEQVLLRLGLRDCADNLIGNDLVKGISGGEKRRVSIGIQILTEPRVLILDEPTSGLDVFTAACILSTLQTLAAEGSTIILSIHQPRSEFLRLFGSVLLLAKGGHAVYAGPSKDMLSYLNSCGHACPEDVNPADYALDLTSLASPSSSQTSTVNETVESLAAAWARQKANTPSRPPSRTLPVPLPASLGSLERQRIPALPATRLLLHRSALSLMRSPPAILTRTAQLLGFTILTTLFFAPLENDYPGVQSHVGFLQQVLAVYFVGMLQNVAIYPAEKSTLDDEHDDGVYHVEPFFFSYTILELPFEIVTSALFSVLATFAVGLPRTGTVFGVMAFACFGLVNCGESIGMIFNTLFRSTGFAVSLVSVVLSLGLVMSGILSTDLNSFLDAINHLSPGKWATVAMASYALRGVSFTCLEREMINGRCPIETGNDVLRLYHLNTPGGLALAYLAILIVGYRMLAYVVLKVTKGEWRVRACGPRHERESPCQSPSNLRTDEK